MYEQLGGELVVTYVVDGSPDRCFELLREALPNGGVPARLILHSRNFGSFAAIRTGLMSTEADFYSVMSADLQEPPELILSFYRKMENDQVDLVLGTRDSRDDPWSTRLFSSIFWDVYRRFILKEIPKGGVDVFGCNRRSEIKFSNFREARSSLVAQLVWVGFQRAIVPYRRQARLKGKSAWTFRKKLDYLMDSVFAFTDLPIRLLMLFGFIGVSVSFVIGVAAIFSKLIGLTTISGYTALMIAIVFFGALNMLGLGIVGAYSQRAYENTKRRPLSIVAGVMDFNRD